MSNYKKYLNVYEFDVTLPGTGETIRIKPLTTGQIKKLLIYENERDPKIIDTILDDMINDTVISPEDFTVDNLSLQDRFFLLVEIRKKSKGNLYKFKWTCPQCDTQNFASVSIDKMKLIPLPEEVDYIIPLDENLSLRMKYLTRGEVKQIYSESEMAEGATPSQRIAELAMINNAASIENIISPDGEESPTWQEKVEFLDEAPQSFYEKITDWIKEYNYGVDFSYKLKCKGCGRTIAQEVPLEDFFF